MEFIPINDTRLKIILSKGDLDEFDMRADELDYSSAETKRIFWDIIARAKHSVGFNCDGMRVLVQLYTSRDGGCELFVSQLSCAYEPEGASDGKASIHCKSAYRKDESTSRRGVFVFERLEWLLTVCRRLCEIGYSGESSAYISDDRRFYLFLDGLDATGFMRLDEYSFICEYGSAESVEATDAFLSEHGKQIRTPDAVQLLSKL